MCVKLLFDQNVSYRLVARLEKYYPNSLHVEVVGLDKSSDFDVWRYAKENNFVLVSKDSDFNEICALYNFPPYIIWLRIGNSRITDIENILIKHQKKICEIVKDNKTGIIEINQ